MSEIHDRSKIPVFILAGGMGTRIAEETLVRPKPMIEVGGLPILIHIMNWYYSFGFQDFVVCAGYLSWEIKEYFLNYNYRAHGLVIDTRSQKSVVEPFGNSLDNKKWRVRVLETGANSMTGSRLAKAFDAVWPLDKFADFAVTYGDGLTDADLERELAFHHSHGGIGTVLGVPPMARFGELQIERAKVIGFAEKPKDHSGLINGGFFFFKKDFRKYLSDADSCIFERMPLETLAIDKKFYVFEHRGFWHCMDTLRDKQYLQKLWDEGQAPWVPSAPATERKKQLG